MKQVRANASIHPFLRRNPRTLMFLSRFMGLGLLALSMSGCASLQMSSPFLKPPRWTVELSSLDHVAMKWTPGQRITSESPRTILVELMGNGYLTMASGSGGSVNDPFAHAREGFAPADETRNQVVISEKETEQFFQRLVDTGFFEDKLGLSGGKTHSGPSLLIFAKINGRKLIQSTDDPETMRLFRVLLKAF